MQREIGSSNLVNSPASETRNANVTEGNRENHNVCSNDELTDAVKEHAQNSYGKEEFPKKIQMLNSINHVIIEVNKATSEEGTVAGFTQELMEDGGRKMKVHEGGHVGRQDSIIEAEEGNTGQGDGLTDNLSEAQKENPSWSKQKRPDVLEGQR